MLLFQRRVVMLATVVALVAGLPADLDTLSAVASSTRAPTATPLLEKELEHMHITVSQPRDGEYGVDVYQESADDLSRLPTTMLTLPPGWHLPGKEDSRVVHAELLSSGDVVVVVFSLENGLDVVLLNKELFLPNSSTSPLQAIVFPEVSVPWHPTLSTPADKWPWTSSDVEEITPSSVQFPKPEKVVGPVY
ncbi:uncharacterized protein [Procambarus clarkii]|uniref:uncharacterized protein n=1 Tax=Procambarus clarkii TaxID=6728 RepID=UPI001E674927|nr:uncharacterized protein LOC123762698 [Procambarus clarkii]